MWVLWTILGLIGALLLVTLVRAAFWTPERTESEPLPDEAVDVEKYRKDLSDAIRIKTISNVDTDKVDWGTLDRVLSFLKSVSRSCTST